MPTVYKPETYEVVSRWMDETPVRYGTNTKRYPSKSYDRYETYAKAATVGEALRLGSKPEDLLFDYEHGHLKPLGPPVREAAIDPTSVTDLSRMTKTDMIVSKWAGWGFREGDETRKLVRQLPDGSFKVVIMDYISEHRKEANATAAAILQEATREGRKVRECEVLRILRLWRFQKNDARQNVLPEGQDFVFSDTLGLIRARDGRYLEKEATREFPDVTRLLCRWLRDHRPAELQEDFPFTSINVNFKYAARRHRDGNNCGPSMIKALGKFTGGNLGYFPNDDQSTSLEDLPASDRVSLNLKKGTALFNGNCAHEVDDFEGERYSLVFFSIGKWWKTPEDVRRFLVACGVSWPAEASMARAKALLQAPRGYGARARPLAAGAPEVPGVRQWPTDPAELAEADAEPEERPRERAPGAAAAGAEGPAGEVAPKKRGQRSVAAESGEGPAAAAAGAAVPMEVTPTPARKRGRREQPTETPAKAAAALEGECTVGAALGAEVLAEAEQKGLRGALANLAGRPEVASKGFAGAKLLAALVQSGGLVNPAKHALLAGAA